MFRSIFVLVWNMDLRIPQIRSRSYPKSVTWIYKWSCSFWINTFFGCFLLSQVSILPLYKYHIKMGVHYMITLFNINEEMLIHVSNHLWIANYNFHLELGWLNCYFPSIWFFNLLTNYKPIYPVFITFRTLF